ncbi:CbiX/SirB N-terminal domain-containing protein [Frigidibacter sp. MR17.24]|uniref:CbiX/SirB N-terminal domain-containing protein n=1 Tax=Frigidibacter sp. MR17.24 TaxID=3127345 RepID=UPI003012E812
MPQDTTAARATALRVLIAAHGQPSDPGPAADALVAFAARVAGHLPAGARVAAATLAEPGAIDRAAAALGAGAAPILVYPMFMAPGWFTRSALPARLAEAGLPETAVTILPPFGTEPDLPALAEREIAAALGTAGWSAGETRLLLAAHGSFKSAAPAEIARAFAEGLVQRLGLAGAEAAFIDQAPQISGARGWPERSLCLPFFAASGGHVEQDLPRALAEARFPGPCLAPVGISSEAPALVAATLLRAAA